VSAPRGFVRRSAARTRAGRCTWNTRTSSRSQPPPPRPTPRQGARLTDARALPAASAGHARGARQSRDAGAPSLRRGGSLSYAPPSYCFPYRTPYRSLNLGQSTWWLPPCSRPPAHPTHLAACPPLSRTNWTRLAPSFRTNWTRLVPARRSRAAGAAGVRPCRRPRPRRPVGGRGEACPARGVRRQRACSSCR